RWSTACRLPLVLLSLGLGACQPLPPPEPDLAAPTDAAPGTDLAEPADAAPGPDLAEPMFRSVYSAGQQELDVLFVIDNSPSMAPKQRALAEAIPRFIQ